MLFKILACAVALVFVSDLANAQWSRQWSIQPKRRTIQPEICMASSSRYRFNYNPQPKCGKVIAVGLSAEEKRAIVDQHNRLRRNVQAGLEKRGEPGPQPAAVHMKTIVWDDKLARTAQNLANECEMKHDECRHYPEEAVGQNVGYRGHGAPLFEDYLSPKTIINGWYDEVKHYSRNSINNFVSMYNARGQQIAHYTQLIWAETNRVGCGAVKYFHDSYYKIMLVCNYGPSGNVRTYPVYQTR